MRRLTFIMFCSSKMITMKIVHFISGFFLIVNAYCCILRFRDDVDDVGDIGNVSDILIFPYKSHNA